MSTTEQQCPIAHAATLLRESAEELRETATLAPSHEWIEGKATSAKAAHDEYMAVAMALDGMSEETANLRAGYGAARLEIESLRAQLEAVKPPTHLAAKWQVVPRQLTQDMAEAAKFVDGRLSVFKYADAYRAMLAAAPTPPLTHIGDKP